MLGGGMLGSEKGSRLGRFVRVSEGSEVIRVNHCFPRRSHL